MARQNDDFLTAFAIGAALGVGATLLLRPERPNPRKQLQKRLKPHVRKMSKRAARNRRVAGRAAPPSAAAPPMHDDAIEAGRELLAEFRGEVRRILDEAREELRELAGDAPPRRARGGGPEAGD